MVGSTCGKSKFLAWSQSEEVRGDEMRVMMMLMMRVMMMLMMRVMVMLMMRVMMMLMMKLHLTVCLFMLLDLSNMYELLSPVEDSLDVFATEFEEHLTNTGLAVMQSLQGDNVCVHR